MDDLSGDILVVDGNLYQSRLGAVLGVLSVRSEMIQKRLSFRGGVVPKGL